MYTTPAMLKVTENRLRATALDGKYQSVYVQVKISDLI